MPVKKKRKVKKPVKKKKPSAWQTQAFAPRGRWENPDNFSEPDRTAENY